MKPALYYAAAATVNKVGDGDGGLITTVSGILQAIIAALGLVAVVVMIIGGYNYMTSSGDSAKVEKAKKTILYGLIGLIVCALAFVIVNFVIGSILQGEQPANNNSEAQAYYQTQMIN